ncbi:unnamed protein product, partial [Phaeothamnion confervicola]
AWRHQDGNRRHPAGGEAARRRATQRRLHRCVDVVWSGLRRSVCLWCHAIFWLLFILLAFGLLKKHSGPFGHITAATLLAKPAARPQISLTTKFGNFSPSLIYAESL